MVCGMYLYFPTRYIGHGMDSIVKIVLDEMPKSKYNSVSKIGKEGKYRPRRTSDEFLRSGKELFHRQNSPLFEQSGIVLNMREEAIAI